MYPVGSGHGSMRLKIFAFGWGMAPSGQNLLFVGVTEAFQRSLIVEQRIILKLAKLIFDTHIIVLTEIKSLLNQLR